MSLLNTSERHFAKLISGLAYCNPFLPERIEFERAALGGDFLETRADWNVNTQSQGMHPNIDRLCAQAEELAGRARDRLLAAPAAGRPDELELYDNLVLFLLYHRYSGSIQQAVERAMLPGSRDRERMAFYRAFARDMQHFFDLPGVVYSGRLEPEHLFACFFQLRRAFHHIFSHIIGSSPPAVRLRANVWQSVFTHDMRRYRRSLYQRMGDVTCLIMGPSGTGKELVAQAIGLSRYIPFDSRSETFTEDVLGSFSAVNLSALSPTLIESELFGHSRGAFTGALQDRAGWLEMCRPLGTVFLDEIGDVDKPIQVKLLRVLQTRTFQRLGDTRDRRFEGKIIAATNRNLTHEMHTGAFREDLYYRLCSDIITTPSLYEQLVGNPAELRTLTLFIARRIAGEQEAAALADEVMNWIESHLGIEYAWPGNVRELEQCVRNVMIRSAYQPSKLRESTALDRLAQGVRAGELTADELLNAYCTLIYARTDNYQETSRRLGLDHRTVKARIVPDLLSAFRGESGH